MHRLARANFPNRKQIVHEILHPEDCPAPQSSYSHYSGINYSALEAAVRRIQQDVDFLMHFVELYHGEFSEERLLRALRSIHPVDIYRIGQDDPAKLRGWKKYVFPIYTAYNGKCRKDALPMKF